MMVLSPMSLMSSILVVFGGLVSLSSETWVSLWLGMELNLYGFLVLMNSSGHYVPEPCVKYFVVQSLGSIGMLSGIILSMGFYSALGWPVMLSSVVLKTGIFPTHSWVPSVVKNSSWACGALLLSWQKVAPLVFLSVILSPSIIWMAVIFMSLIGGVGGLNQHSVRMMSAYSSFVHTGWMFASLMFSMEMFILYFALYSASTMALFYGCSLVEKSKMSSKGSSSLVGLSLGMLSGIPPFVGFLGKLVVFVVTKSPMILFCVVGSVISLKFYIDFFYSMILSSHKEKMYVKVSMSATLILALNFCVFVGVVLLLM